MKPTFRVASIAGDGIGKEVLPEGLRVLNAASDRFGFELQIREIPWASCDWYAQHGQMMPDDWKQQLAGIDAIYFGAVGWPATVPDNVSLWGSLLKFRREFDQYVNLRPVRLLEGVKCPLAGRSPGDIDYLVVRENTEGEYTNLGGVMFAGTDREFVIQESVFTRLGADRVLRYAFELAKSRSRKHVTVATKSNGVAISMPWWDTRADEVSKAYPEVTIDKQHIDILSARFVLQPERFDVVVASIHQGFSQTESETTKRLIRAAENLGASQIETFRRVTLPLILPGVASGAVFAFAASFDEVVVALLIAGPGQRTLPRQMFAGINDNISLTIAAAATMLIAISLLLMIAVGWLQRRSARMRQSG